jgi:hypothetical protein
VVKTTILHQIYGNSPSNRNILQISLIFGNNPYYRLLHQNSSPGPHDLSPGLITGENIKGNLKIYAFFVIFQGKIVQNTITSLVQIDLLQLLTYMFKTCTFLSGCPWLHITSKDR